MKKHGFDMCADSVQIDLLQLKKVLGEAVKNSREQLEKYQRQIDDKLTAAMYAEIDGDSAKNYHALCHANSTREYMAKAAKEYADAINAYFHICEAIKRDIVTTVKE